MNAELKPCPFCGGSAWTEEYPVKDGLSTFSAYCERCGAETSLSYKSREEAAEAWNTRAEPRTCATCYYYQTVYDRNRPTDRRACFGEHLRVAVGGLDWDEEAEAWAVMEPEDSCSKWTPEGDERCSRN